MKTKKLSKKLILNKKTVVNLNSAEMSDVNGGKVFPPISQFGCVYTLDSICVVSYCFCDPYEITEYSCQIPLCVR